MNNSRFFEEVMKNSNEMRNTVILDLDGVIVDFNKCKNRCNYNNYPDSVEKLKRLECPLSDGCLEVINYIRSLGLKIIINTGRVEAERQVTEHWLKIHNVPYDLLIMNKPRGIIYIDDLGFQFKDWKSTQDEILRRVNR